MRSVRKGNSFEDNYEAVLDYMDALLVNSQYINEFLLSTSQSAAGQMNKLHIFDSYTRKFNEFYAVYRDKDSSLYMEANSIRNALKDHPLRQEDLGNFFFVLEDVFNRICDEFFLPLGSTIELYAKESATEAPYAIMHYDSRVKEVASKHLFMSLGYPINDGTRYIEIARKMLARCRELAKSVAKMAP